MRTTTRLKAISFELPAGWQETSFVSLLGPLDGDVRMNAVVTNEPTQQSLVDRVKAHLRELQQQLPSYTAQVERSHAFNGQPAIWLEHTFRAQNGAGVRQLQVLSVVAGELWVVTATHAAARFEAVRPQLEALVSSIQL